MENEIKVGDWIRTKDGVIDKIVDFRDTYSERKLIAFEKSNTLKSDIGLKAMVVKHSTNLIDLIQCGDYVNGYKVVKADLESKEYGKYVDVYCPSMNLKLEFLEHIFEEHIKTVVTKEMMESISYKVKE